MFRTRKLPPILMLLPLIAVAFCASAQDLPSTPAEPLSGKKMDFPAGLRGNVSVCVFGFGKNSSNKVTVWLESLSGDGINAWSVVNIENEPAPIRGVTRMGLRKGIPNALLSRSLVMTKDANAWKAALELTKDTLPVVALFDADGKLVWKRQGTFSSVIGDELKAQIAGLAKP